MATVYREFYMEQILPTSTAAYTTGGLLEYRISTSDLEAVDLSRSYFLLDTQVKYDGSGNPTDVLYPSQFFTQVSHQLNGVQIANSIEPVLDSHTMYESNMSYGQAQSISNNAYALTPQTLTGASGYLTAVAGFRPPMNLWVSSDPMFGGQHVVRLSMRSPTGALVAADGSGFGLGINSINLYAAKVKPQEDVRIPPSLSTPVPAMTSRVTSACGTGTSLTTNFVIPASTYGCVLRFCESSDIYRKTIPGTIVTWTARYRGQSLPLVPYTNLFNSPTYKVDPKRAYLESMAGFGNLNVDGDFMESYDTWVSAPMYYMNWSHRQGDESTNFVLQFTNGATTSVIACITFLYSSVIEQDFQGGQLRAVRFVEDSI